MTLTKVALTVAAAAVATNMLLKSRRGQPDFAATEPGDVDLNESLDGAYGTDGTDAANDTDASTAPAAVNAMAPAAAGVGADSPNDAERLEANGLGTAPQAGIADDPLKSTSQEGSQARAPGLPDFFRGA